MKKRIVTLLLCALLGVFCALPLAACSGDKKENKQPAPAEDDSVLLYNEVGTGAYEVVNCYADGTKEITIPDTHNNKPVIGIGVYAFKGNTDIEKITLPRTLEYIDAGAFEKCSSLKTVVFPDKLDEIYNGAFYDCTALDSITLPSGISYIDAEVFIGTGYEQNKNNFVDGMLYIGEYCIEGNYSYFEQHQNETFNIKSGTKLIARNALAFPASHARSVVIPDSVETILPNDREAIAGLSNFKLGSGIKKIYNGAFNHVTLDDEKTNSEGLYIVDNVLLGAEISVAASANNNLDIHIGADITAIADGALSPRGTCIAKTITVDPANPRYYSQNNCVIEKATKKLVAGSASSVIPSDVKEIGDYAFYGCRNNNIAIPAGVTKIGMAAFYGFEGMEEITIPDSVKVIGNNAFFQSSFKTINIGKGLERMGYTVSMLHPMGFTTYNYTGSLYELCCIKSFGIWQDVYSSGCFEYLLLNGNTLPSVVVPDGIECLDPTVCAKTVRTITLPDSVKSIGYCAFGHGGMGLETLKLGKGIRVINQLSRYVNIIMGDVYYDGSISDWMNVQFNGDVVRTAANPMSTCDSFYVDGKLLEGTLYIPDGITTISYGAFAVYPKITSVVIPASVTKINRDAFIYSGLTSAVFSDPNGWVCGGESVDAAILSNEKSAAAALTKGFGDFPVLSVSEFVKEG